MKKSLLILSMLGTLLVSGGKHSNSNRPNKLNLLPGRLAYKMDNMEFCENKSTALRIFRVEFDKFQYNPVYNADAEIYRQINITLAVFRIDNCEDKNRASCQNFQKWRFGKELCAALENKAAFWSPMFQNINPRLHCPFAPGKYAMRNGTIDLTLFQQLPMPLEKYVWRFQYELFDSSRVFCFDAMARFMRIHT